MRELAERLWQGDVSDLNSLKLDAVRERYGITLAVNVGSTAWVPRGMPSFHVPMWDVVNADDPYRSRNDWNLLVEVAALVVDELIRGGTALVNCDAGVSRSVVFCAMVIGMRSAERMDQDLRELVRHSTCDPSQILWDDAAAALDAYFERASRFHYDWQGPE